MTDTAIRLREVQPDDLNAVFALADQVHSIHVKAEPGVFRPLEKNEAFETWFKDLLAKPDQHLVLACSGDTAIGFLQYYLGLLPETFMHRERRIAYVNALVVDKAYRRSGCGTLLLDHVKQEAQRQGITQLGIDFWSFNDAARRCFEKAGFRVRRETMWQDL